MCMLHCVHVCVCDLASSGQPVQLQSGGDDECSELCVCSSACPTATNTGNKISTHTHTHTHTHILYVWSHVMNLCTILISHNWTLERRRERGGRERSEVKGKRTEVGIT